MAFCYAAREALRRQHNANGAAFRAGVISRDQWEAYLAGDFFPKDHAIAEAEGRIRQSPPLAELDRVDLRASFRDTE